nr:unnamed protein product [Brassica rapa]
MASTDGLVPITRAFLASYYNKYPFPPLSDDVSRLSSDMASLIQLLTLQSPPSQALAAMISFQTKNSESVFNTVMTYMPQDFRGTLIRQQKERSERNKQAEVDALVSSGGTIRDTYALLWKQQMER